MKRRHLIALRHLTTFCALAHSEITTEREPPPFQAKVSGIATHGILRDLYLFSSGEFLPMNFFTGVRSTSINYSGPRELALYKKLTREDGTINWIPTASTQLLGNASDYLLFVSQDKTNQQIRVLSIPEDRNVFKFGSYRFFNTTPKRLALKIGDSQQFIEPMNYVDIDGEYTSGEDYDLKLAELFTDGKAPRLIYSNRLYYNSEMRMLYLITQQSNGRRTQLIGIPQKATR